MKGLRKLSKRYYVNQILAFLLVSFMVVNPVLAVVPPAGNALPAGGSVPGLPGQYGSVGSFEYDPVNPILHIMDVAEQTVIDWTTFDIGQDALTQFHQLGANPMVLNRVTGSTEPSGIYGQLLANGSVFIVNNYGVVFGPDSFVQARNFVASAIEIGIEDFMVNNFLFEKGIESPYGDVINEGNIEAEGFVALIGRNVTNKGTITVDPGGYVVMAAGERVLLNKQGSEVYVEMFEASIPSMHVVDHGGDGGSGPGTGPGEIVTGSGPGTGNVNVILAAGDIFSTAITGVESLRAEAKGDITLNGAVQATGDITLTAAADGGPGDMWAKSTLTSDTGSIEISASDDTIDLDADVTAAVDLVLNNDTFAADGITLKAGRDVDIAPLKLLTAEGDLTIEATTGEIKEDPFIDMAADSKTLTLTQNDSLNLTTNFNIFNRNNTDLVANSTGGSVNSSEADQWQSIAGRAFGTIDLFDTDSGDDITVGALTADTGDILIHSKDKVHIQGLLSAGRHVKIAAADESSGASILISSDGTAAPEIEAGVYEVSPGVKEKGDIWLGNNTSIDGPASLKASQDIRVGYDENLGIYQPKTLEGEDSLTLNAGRHITLGGDVTLHNASQNSFDLALLADSAVWTTGSLDGKMHAMGTITTEGSLDSIRITASDIGTIDLDDNVTAGYDIKLFANTVVAPDKMLVAGHDVILSNGKTMTGEGVLTIEADRHITLGGDVEAAGTLTLRADADLSGGPLGGNMWAKGTLTTTAGDIDIYASDSTIILSGDKVEAMGDVKLHDNTKLNGSDQRIEATTGSVITDDGVNIDKTAAGNLNIKGGTGIELGGDVTGSNMTASDAITFESNVTAYGTGSQRLDADLGKLVAQDGVDIDKTTPGSLNLGGDEGIELGGNVRGTGMTASDAITLEDDVKANGTGSQRLDADLGKLVAQDGVDIDKTTPGSLNLGGDEGIELGGNVRGTGMTASDAITLEDDVKANGTGSQRLDADLGKLVAQDGVDIDKTTPGSLNLGGDEGIELGGNVRGTGMTASDAITLEDDVKANGTGSQRLDADLGKLVAQDGVDIDKTTPGSLNLGGDEGIELGGNVRGTGMTASDAITLEDDVKANGTGSQRLDADLGKLVAQDGVDIDKTTPGSLNLGGDEGIELGGNVRGTGMTASDAITLEDDVKANGTGSQRLDADLGKLVAQDGVDIDKTTPGSLNLGGDEGIELGGNVRGTGMTASDAITLEDDVKANGTGSQRLDADLGKLVAQDGVDIDKTTPGSLNLGGDEGIELGGNVRGTGMTASDAITLEDDVKANGTGSQRLDADLGKLVAQDGVDIDKTTPGSLNLGGDEGIELGGNVRGTGMTASDAITLEDDVKANGTGSQRLDADLGKLVAQDGVDIDKTTPGSLNLGGDEGIELGGNVRGTGMTASDAITLEDDVKANGTGSQRLDADLGKLVAQDGVDIDKTTPGSLNLGGDTAIRLAGDVTGTTGFGAGDTITFEDDVTADGGSQRFDAGLGTLDADGNIEKTTAGNLNLGGDAGIELGGNVRGTGMTASDAITLEDDVKANGTGSQRLDADLGKLVAQDGVDIDKTTPGSLNLGGDEGIELGGNVRGTGMTASDAITLEDDVKANGTGSQRLDADAGTLWARSILTKTTTGDLTLGGDTAIDLDGTVDVYDGSLTIEDAFNAGGDLRASENVTLDAAGILDGATQGIDAEGGKLWAKSTLTKTTTGDLTLGGDTAIDLDGTVDVDDGSLTIEDAFNAEGDLLASENVTLDAAGILDGATQRIDAEGGKLWAKSTLTKTTTGDLILAGDTAIDLDGTVDVDDGSLTIEDDVSAAGDLLASDDVTFEGSIVNTTLDGAGDQTIQAETGTLTATGWVRKVTEGHLWLLGGEDTEGELAVDLQHNSKVLPGPAASTCEGNLWIEGEGDVQISGDLTTFGPYITKNGEGPMWRPTGGVAVISNEGKIYTADGGANDTLNVTVEGNSDHKAGLGVDLPHGDGKAAIMIISKEDLKIGSDAQLHASGTYYDDVDDRAGMNLLDEPTTIGGVPRDEGDPFDVAIYVASTEGNVDVSSPVTIMSGFPRVAKQEPIYESEYKGAMVIDAFDTVTFGLKFEESLAGDGVTSYVGDRLEVVSRISEWLFQAVGRLPYVYGGGPFVPGYAYVLRGAGQGNPAIVGIDDRAWVLEDPLEPAPLYREAGEDTEEQEFAEGGCPALMAWFADEVGVPEDQIQVIVQNAFAYATDIQPCEACARLRDAATILNDEEGTYMAALGQVVNEFATPDAPIAPEQMTLIASAVASAEPGTNYAAAGEWLDSLVQYVAVMNTEMGYSSAEAVAFVGKYTTPITEGGDVSLVEYVETRLAELGG